MVNFSNGKIYKIVSDQTDKIYIGSTTQPLCKRITEHRSKFKINYGCASEEIMKFGDARIILIESYPCKSKEELLAREDYWHNKFKDICVNKYKSNGLDPAKKNNKWNINNREKCLASKKKYNQKRWYCKYCCKKMAFTYKNTHKKSNMHLIIKNSLICEI